MKQADFHKCKEGINKMLLDIEKPLKSAIHDRSGPIDGDRQTAGVWGEHDQNQRSSNSLLGFPRGQKDHYTSEEFNLKSLCFSPRP